jgi:hypothetical protein
VSWVFGNRIRISTLWNSCAQARCPILGGASSQWWRAVVEGGRRPLHSTGHSRCAALPRGPRGDRCYFAPCYFGRCYFLVVIFLLLFSCCYFPISQNVYFLGLFLWTVEADDFGSACLSMQRSFLHSYSLFAWTAVQCKTFLGSVGVLVPERKACSGAADHATGAAYSICCSVPRTAHPARWFQVIFTHSRVTAECYSALRTHIEYKIVNIGLTPAVAGLSNEEQKIIDESSRKNDDSSKKFHSPFCLNKCLFISQNHSTMDHKLYNIHANSKLLMYIILLLTLI